MPKLLDFEDHLMDSLKDLHESAYFLAASLQEAIAENDADHFFTAAGKIKKATGKSFIEVLNLLHTHIAPADFPNVDENLSIMMAKLVQEIDALKERPQMV